MHVAAWPNLGIAENVAMLDLFRIQPCSFFTDKISFSRERIIDAFRQRFDLFSAERGDNFPDVSQLPAQEVMKKFRRTLSIGS